MTDIELHAKTDRELLIMVVDKLNTLAELVGKHEKCLAGNGWPGLKFQVRVMWAAFISLLVYILK